MDKYRKYRDLDLKKDAFKLAVLFVGFGITWIIFKDLYFSNFNGSNKQYKRLDLILSSIFIIIISLGVYILAYNRGRKTRMIQEELVKSLKEMTTVYEEKQSCEISLKNQEFITESFTRDINLGVINWNNSLEITGINPYFLRVTRYDEKELLGKNILDMLIDDSKIDYKDKAIEDIIDVIESGDNIIRVSDKDGNILEFSTYHMALEDIKGDITEIVTFALDITEKNILERKLKHLAYYDDVTGLPNKHLLRTYLTEKFSEKNLKMGLLHIEIDGYDLINESSGHEEAELLLKEVSYMICSNISKDNYLAKISENEFILVINDRVSRKELESMSEDLLKQILEPIAINGSTIHLSAKIGISIYPDISNSLDNLLKEAHLALHHIKYDLEDHYSFFKREIGEKIDKENYIIQELDKAIINKEFIPYFQPIWNMGNKSVLGLETLIRWHHREKGFVSPGHFIPIAEETGQIYKITDIILEKALEQKQVWNKRGLKDMKISVNISSKSFEKGELELELKILELLAKYEIQPDELILEITETAAVSENNVSEVLNTFNRFKGIGVEIALDDFGTGNSSLSRLNKLPIKYVKLDRSFINNIENNGEEQEVVKTIVDLAHKLDLVVIAEGIETMEQRKALVNIGCKIGQGYYLARPAPAEEIERLL